MGINFCSGVDDTRKFTPISRLTGCLQCELGKRHVPMDVAPGFASGVSHRNDVLEGESQFPHLFMVSILG